MHNYAFYGINMISANWEAIPLCHTVRALTPLTRLQWFRILLPSSWNILWNRQTHIPQLPDVAPLHLPTAELNNKKIFHSKCLRVTWLINFFKWETLGLEMLCFSALICKRGANAAGDRRGKCNLYKCLKNATSIESKNQNQCNCNAKREIKRKTTARQIWTDLTHFAWRSRIVDLFYWVRYPAKYFVSYFTV